MAEKKIPTHEELKKGKHHKQIRNVNEAHRNTLTPLEQFAVWITDHIGSMGFFIIIVAWTVVWLGWNTLGPAALRFDPFPAFVLWLFLSNVLQIFLMPLIMIGQNLQGRHSEIRAESDFEVNVKAEQEIETILLHLERQNELMLTILHHLGKEGRKKAKE
jgi:uncharacterized membrane protein